MNEHNITELAESEFNSIDTNNFDWNYFAFESNSNKDNLTFLTQRIEINPETINKYAGNAFKSTNDRKIFNKNDNTKKEFNEYTAIQTNDSIPFLERHSKLIKDKIEIIQNNITAVNKTEYSIEKSNGYLLYGVSSNSNLIFLFKHVPITIYKNKLKRLPAKEILSFDKEKKEFKELQIDYGTLYYTIDAIISKNFLYLITDDIYKLFKIDTYVEKTYKENIKYLETLNCECFDIEKFIKRSKDYKRYFCDDNFKEFSTERIKLLNDNKNLTIKKYDLDLTNFEKNNIKLLVYYITGKEIIDEKGNKHYVPKEEKIKK